MQAGDNSPARSSQARASTLPGSCRHLVGKRGLLPLVYRGVQLSSAPQAPKAKGLRPHTPLQQSHSETRRPPLPPPGSCSRALSDVLYTLLSSLERTQSPARERGRESTTSVMTEVYGASRSTASYCLQADRSLRYQFQLLNRR